MILFFMILTVVVLIIALINWSYDEYLICEIVARIFFPVTSVLFVITLFINVFVYNKALDNCKRAIADNYKGCIFVEGSNSFVYEGELYEATIEYDKNCITKWNSKDIDYVITVFKQNIPVTVITSKDSE